MDYAAVWEILVYQKMLPNLTKEEREEERETNGFIKMFVSQNIITHHKTFQMFKKVEKLQFWIYIRASYENLPMLVLQLIEAVP